MMGQHLLLWGGFALFILVILAIDLGFLRRKAHVVKMGEALGWFGVWSGLALVFNIGIILLHSRHQDAGLEFFTGYLVEMALSIDNIFIFILLFGYFKIPPIYQHKVLFWGILAALVLRGGFILGGLALLERFHWMIYVFGGFLLFTGISMMRQKDAETDPSKNFVLRIFRKFFPVSENFDNSRFFTKQNGKRLATPLFLVLLAIESSDIIFAVDSIPAIFAITQDPFIVFTSNIFAMLGLRSLYFAVSGFMKMFHFLHYGFASIVIILGIKMLVSSVYEVPIALSLVLILVILLVCIIVSLMRPRRDDLKLMFERPEKLGLLPFRRLLMIENIVDLGEVKVSDAMRSKRNVSFVRLDRSWEENLETIKSTRFSRYPLAEDGDSKPLGMLHVKDLLITYPDQVRSMEDVKALVRPSLEISRDLPLEDALTQFQNHSAHMALVVDSEKNWSGVITFEDILEELVGKIGDEFDAHRGGQFLSLSDGLVAERVIFDVEGKNLSDAITDLLGRIPDVSLPANRKVIELALHEREALMPTYLKRGLAIPHTRMAGIEQPVLLFGRSSTGVPVEGTSELIELIFILLTPEHLARHQPRLLADIVGLIESDYVMERLRNASDPDEVVVAIRDGQQVVLDD